MEANISGFATSRSHVLDIQSAFERAIKIQLSATEGDIETYVRSRLSARFPPLKTQLIEDVVSRVLEKADGMYVNENPYS